MQKIRVEQKKCSVACNQILVMNMAQLRSVGHTTEIVQIGSNVVSRARTSAGLPQKGKLK
jgi:ribosomal protein L32E